ARRDHDPGHPARLHRAPPGLTCFEALARLAATRRGPGCGLPPGRRGCLRWVRCDDRRFPFPASPTSPGDVMSSYHPRHLTPPASTAGTTGTSRRSLLRGGVLGEAALSTGAAALGAPAAQAAGLYGQDVSGWQGEVDWAAQAELGSRFAYVKATEGRSYRSPTFNHQFLGAGDAGLARGGYHFARPDSGGPEEQADFFLNNGGGWTDDGITLPGMVDFESYSGLPRDYGLSAQEMREWI